MNTFALDALVLLATVLSLFLVILVLSSKSFRNDVQLYFAIALMALAFMLGNVYFEAYLPANGVLELVNWEFLFPFAFLMYVLKAIKSPLGSSWSIWLLAIPFLLLSLFRWIDFLLDIDVFYCLAGAQEARLYLLIEAIALGFVLFALALVGFAYYQIRKAKNLFKQERRWLEFNSLFLLLFWVGWLISDPIDLFFEVALWKPLLGLLAIFLILISYFGVHQLNIAEQRRQLHPLQQKRLATQAGAKKRREQIEPAGKAKDGETFHKTSGKVARLHTLMVEEKLYRNPELNRRVIADQLDISEGYLSELLRKNLATGFNDYVNQFRVAEVIQMFNDAEFDLFSIEAIGYEAGFKTKSVFYAAFKKIRQQTPGAYRKSVNKS